MIVNVDFDGSLALGLGFGISEKIPNIKLIDRINYLKSCGNTIKIVTARGAYNSSIEERTKKYYDQIKEYLDKNGVLYDEISFIKEFADIYIDDLAIRPDEIMITKDLSSSFTNNIVTRINDTVVKCGATVHNEYEWYKWFNMNEYKPEILNINRHSIIYKYIEKEGEIDYYKLLDVVEYYSGFNRMNNIEFSEYVNSISNHLALNKSISNGLSLIRKLAEINIRPTFAHGDLSVYNVIPTKDGFKLIDPLYHEGKFGSITTDLAKLLFSIKFYLGNYRKFEELRSFIHIDNLDVLIASECVRVASYNSRFSFIAENLINEL
jgi:hypothetical protein